MKTAQQLIKEYEDSKKVKYINIAQFNAKGLENGETAIIQIAKRDNLYYFVAKNGCFSTSYRSIEQAKLDIIDCYGMFKGFKLLVD